MAAYTEDRLTREEALELIDQIRPILVKLDVPFQIAGSYRREKQSIGDLDFVVADCDLPHLLKLLNTRFKLAATPRAGDLVMTVIIPFRKKKIQVEFVNVAREAIGSGVLHSTGSGQFNMGLRGFAKGKGLTLSQHGLFHGHKFIAGKTEEEVFKALGLGYIPPQEREQPFNQLKKKYLINPNTGNVKPSGGWSVQGKHDVYTVQCVNGKWTCTCPHFRFRHPVDGCDHIEQVKQRLQN